MYECLVKKNACIDQMNTIVYALFIDSFGNTSIYESLNLIL